ncbi:MAG: hypothetical protein AAF212_11090, partial [Verrucomicrobiota bacterium]
AEVDGSELIYKHGDFESYYKNRSDGLEHGFTIFREVSEFVDAETGDLVIPIELLGVRAEKLDPTSERGDLQFVDASGEALIAYTGLKVWDSTERLLAASMNPVANGFEIRVGTREVEYPIFVDPLITSLESKLGPSNTGSGDISDNFGLSVSILGDLAIMGAPNDGDNGSNSGSAYIFRNSGGVWIEEQKIFAVNGESNEFFGTSVVAFANRVLVGAPNSVDANSRVGHVFSFEYDVDIWVQSDILSPNIGETFDGFGRTMSSFQDMVAIGAPDDDEGGSAYLFEYVDDEWGQTIRFDVPTEEGDLFGQSLSLSADSVFVGAPNDDDAGNDAGSVYVFGLINNQWEFVEKITASDASSGDNFGQSVSISGARALIGALDAGVEDGGRAYAFSLVEGSWTEDQILSVASIVDLSFFGRAVALSNTHAFIGAYGEDAVYVFELSGGSWVEMQTLSGVEDSNFGFTLSTDADDLLIGAPLEDAPRTDSGRAYVYQFDGTSWLEDATLDAGDGGNSIFFGSSIGIDGDLAAVGVPDDHDNGLASGSVYVFRKTGGDWLEEDKLLASDGEASHEFGYAVAVDANTILIGDPLDSLVDNNNGSAYFYTFSNDAWSEQQKIVASDGAANDNFGTSVDIFEDTAFVGARRSDSGALNSGSVYVYLRSNDNWTESQILTAPDAADNDEFGVSVSVSGGYAAIGSYRDDPLGSNSGSVYIYSESDNTWAGMEKLTASDGTEFDEFGTSVDIVGSNLVVGAPKYDPGGNRTGGVYWFTESSGDWSEQQILTDSQGAAFDDFGASLSLSGNFLAVGAPLDDSDSSNTGSVVIFEFLAGSWSEAYKVMAPDPSSNDRFGEAIALDGTDLLVGAPNTTGLDGFGGESRFQGSVYAYTLGDGYTLVIASVGQGTTNPLGTGGQLSGATVSIHATADFGYRFDAWSGDFSGSANPLEFLMSQDYTVIANFVEDTNDDDGDGLSNFSEAVVFKTNPNAKDSNGDGFEDGDLVEANFDPAVDYGELRTIIESQLEDARVGSVMVDVVDGNVVLRLQIERSENLVDWTDAPEDLVEFQIPISEDLQFFRFGIPSGNP